MVRAFRASQWRCLSTQSAHLSRARARKLGHYLAPTVSPCVWSGYLTNELNCCTQLACWIPALAKGIDETIAVRKTLRRKSAQSVSHQSRGGNVAQSRSRDTAGAGNVNMHLAGFLRPRPASSPAIVGRLDCAPGLCWFAVCIL